MPSQMTTEEINQLITEHWDGYTAPLLRSAGCDPAELELAAFLYRAAWIHGVKHERAEAAERSAK